MIGQKLGSFRILSILGSGAMGIVYKAIHEPSERQAAVKVITLEHSGKGTAADRFEREAEILEKLKHPNIVRYLGVGKSKGTRYFAMEFVDGITLDRYLEQGDGFLPWKEVVEIGIQICSALNYAHGFRVVHRDLKPANLMLAKGTNQLKLADFGIAKDQDATALTATGRTLGTAAYMAPEQISGTPEISHKTDLYSLGCVFYQMLTGRAPFEGTTPLQLMRCHLQEPAPRPSEKIFEIPKALDDLVVQLMSKAPNDRPWDAEAVEVILTDLKQRAERGDSIRMVWPDPTQGTMTAMRESMGTLSSGGGKSKHKRKRKRRRPLAIIEGHWTETLGLLAALCLLFAFAAYMLWPPSADYLYRHAKAAMAGDSLVDWKRADEEYISPLVTRFPGLHKKEISLWHDRIALEDARLRALNIDRGLRNLKNRVEQRYKETYAQATDESKAGRDLVAAQLWRDLAASIKDDRESRGWYLLCEDYADTLDRTVAQRRVSFVESLDRAEALQRSGKVAEANDLRHGLIKRYSNHHDLDDLVKRAQVGLSGTQTDKPQPTDAKKPANSTDSTDAPSGRKPD